MGGIGKTQWRMNNEYCIPEADIRTPGMLKIRFVIAAQR